MVYGQGGTKITLYHSFSAGGYSYSALSLKLKYSATAGTNDTYIVEYSTSGATNCSDYGSRLWTTLVPSTGAAASLVAATASLSTWQNLTQLCVKAYSTKVWSPDNQNFDIYDIWTEGTYTIDTTPPTANVVYDITWRTNQDVIATLTWYSEPITIANNGGSNTYVFTSNDSFTFEFKDAADNTWSTGATVTWIDKTDPVVTLSWPSTMTIYINNVYPEYGASRTDNVDGAGFLTDPTAWSVNTSTLGIYILTYGKTDAVGNYWFTQRSVEITGSTPVVSLNGLEPYDIEYPDSYTEYGATWTDVTDGSGEVANIDASDVDTDTLDSYTVIYTYINSAGLTWTAVRHVTVQDTTAPVVIINGLEIVYVEYGSDYAENGVQRGDAYEGAGDINTITTTSGTVNTGTLWTYTIEYIKVDSSWNTWSDTRTVIVQDTIAPTVTLSASNNNPTNTGIHMTAQFSETITGFTIGDIDIGNWSKTKFVAVNGSTYTFDVIPVSQ